MGARTAGSETCFRLSEVLRPAVEKQPCCARIRGRSFRLAQRREFGDKHVARERDADTCIRACAGFTS